MQRKQLNIFSTSKVFTLIYITISLIVATIHSCNIFFSVYRKAQLVVDDPVWSFLNGMFSALFVLISVPCLFGVSGFVSGMGIAMLYNALTRLISRVNKLCLLTTNK